MLPPIIASIREVAYRFLGIQYTMDHTQVKDEMRKALLDRSAEGNLMFDEKCFYHSPCSRQAQVVKELFDAGC